MIDRYDPDGKYRAGLFFLVLLAVVLFGFNYRKNMPPPPTVSVSDLAKNPSDFWNKTVYVTGSLTLTREHGTVRIVGSQRSLGKEWHFKLTSGNSSIEAVDNTGFSYNGMPITIVSGGEQPTTNIEITLRGRMQKSDEVGTDTFVFMIEEVIP